MSANVAKNVLGNDPFVSGAAKRTKPLSAKAPPLSRPRTGGQAAGRRPGRTTAQLPPWPLAEEAGAAILRGPPAQKVAVAGEARGSAAKSTPGTAPAISVLAEMIALAKWGQQFLAEVASRRGSGPLLACFQTVRSMLEGSSQHPRDPYGQDLDLVRASSPLFEFLCKHYWRIDLDGLENLPPGPAIVVANQAGALPLSGVVLPWVISRGRSEANSLRWLADPSLLETPVFGPFLNRLGAVRATPENASRLLSEQHPVLIFPEGLQGIAKPFRGRYLLKGFGRGGFVKLALRTGAPIIPAAWIGGGESTPLLGRLPAEFVGLPCLPLTTIPLPARWRLRFGQPLQTHALVPNGTEDPEGIYQVVELARSSVATLLQELLANSTSMFG